MQHREESITSSCPQALLDTQTDEDVLDMCEEDVQDVQEDDDMASEDDTWDAMQLSPCGSIALSSQWPSTPDAPSTTGRIFMVERVVKAAGGHRPSILFDGRLLDVIASGPTCGGCTLQQVPEGKELQLSIRYEPPSPKFSRSCPGMVSYRLKLLQGSHFLYMMRGLPQEAVLDTAARAVTWGTLQLVFQTCHQLDSFLAVLRHVQVVPGQVWPSHIAALWSEAQHTEADTQRQAAAPVQRSASILRDSTGSMSNRHWPQMAVEPLASAIVDNVGVHAACCRPEKRSGGVWQAVCSLVHRHAFMATVAGVTAATCLMLARGTHSRT